METFTLIEPLRLEGNVKARALLTLGCRQRKSQEGLVSYRKWSGKISSDLVRVNDGLGLLEKMKWLFLLLHVLCRHRAVCHWKTHSLVFGAPKARRNWHEAKAELIKTEFALRNCCRLHQRTQPHWQKGQTLPWQDNKCIPKCSGVHNSHLEAGGSFLLFWQVTLKPSVIQLPSFVFVLFC